MGGRTSAERFTLLDNVAQTFGTLVLGKMT